MSEPPNWFRRAEEDVRMTELALQDGIYNQACFHAQQAGEKILKGFLLSKKGRYPKTHSLGSLLALCKEVDPSFSSWETNCATLDIYYAPTRYPDAPSGTLPGGDPTREDAEEALRVTKDILGFVKVKLDVP